MKFVFGKQDTTTLDRAQERCCLLTNGPGGYLSVSAAFSVTRCDQGVLAAARTAPNDRWTLVHRLSEALTVGEEQVFLSTQTFADDAPPPAVRSGGPSVRGETGRTLEIVFSLEGGTAWSPASFPRAGRSPATTPRTRPFCCSTACGYTTAGPGTPVSSAGPGRSWSALSPPTAGGPATPSAWSRTAHLRGGGAGPGDMDGRLRGGPSAPRHGKPVEINAHWYNALRMMEELSALTAADGREYYGPGRAGLGELQPGVLDGG